MTREGRKMADLPLAQALASGLTITDAAAKAGVSVKTAQRRLADADFRRTVSQLQLDAVKKASGLLAASMTAAACTLALLLKAKAETVRLGAARAILELGGKLVDAAALAEEVAELRELLEEMRTGKGGAA